MSAEADLAAETDDPIIARMDFQQHPGFGSNRLGVVVGVSAVGGADLAQRDTAFAHHVGNPKRAANLDQLTPRDNALSALGHRIQGQQYGCGVIVDNSGRLGAGQGQQIGLNQGVAVAASGRAQVVLQGHRGGGRADDLVHCGFCQQRPAQIGVQHGAGGVDDRAQGRLRSASASRCLTLWLMADWGSSSLSEPSRMSRRRPASTSRTVCVI